MKRKRRVWLVVYRMIRVSPVRYISGGMFWIGFFVIPIATGLVLKKLFDSISGHVEATLRDSLWLCASFVGVELARALLFLVALNIWPYWWNAATTTLRANVLRSVFTGTGPAASRLPYSSGEAVARFRDDANDVIELTDNVVELTGAIIFSSVALVIMVAIDPVIAFVLVLPLLLVSGLIRALRGVVSRAHRRSTELSATITSFIGEISTGFLSIKLGAAEGSVLASLRERNRLRRDAAVKDRLASDMIDTITSSGVQVSIGLVLLLAAPSMRNGTFTIGDFALFTSYVGWLTMLPSQLGRMLYRVPRATVAIDRLCRLMADNETEDHLSRCSGVWLKSAPPPHVHVIPRRNDELKALEARKLTATYAGSRNGIRGVDLCIRRGSFTVVTGAVGAGKSTLIRAMLGLQPITGGSVAWNGVGIVDPGTFLVPDRVAYIGQTPRLFSVSILENIQLGWPSDDLRIAWALRLAALERDIAQMPDGLETMAGARGVRLSGGQAQRATAARALVRLPELLAADDLSSALDVETERVLWDRIQRAAINETGPSTLLVVSHRKAALERADQVVVLDRGEVAGIGQLAELLRTCQEMRRLWSEDLIDDVTT